MAANLLNEYRAWWIGRGYNTSSCSSYSRYRLCTKAKARSFGISNFRISTYTDNQIIHSANVYALYSTTTTTTGNCPCNNDILANVGCTGNYGCSCWTKSNNGCYNNNCDYWCGGCTQAKQNTACYADGNNSHCSNYCPCHMGNCPSHCPCQNVTSTITICNCESVCRGNCSNKENNNVEECSSYS